MGSESRNYIKYERPDNSIPTAQKLFKSSGGSGQAYVLSVHITDVDFVQVTLHRHNKHSQSSFSVVQGHYSGESLFFRL
ncbi:hypothetical protein TNCV_4001341 [Trichonephila clavipes]|uniref:Uncharacterized protein n=1 Tax=Trichonephila clavipes TaxID=2585209 RepID=A0A8X6RQA9_TRICX|nr:hypothetical protein TNCV_4001341 [Trichonephila clavipes]